MHSTFRPHSKLNLLLIFCSIQEWFSHCSHLYRNGSNCLFWSSGVICNGVISSSTNKGQLGGGYLAKVKVSLLLIGFFSSCHWMHDYCKPYCCHADVGFYFLSVRNRGKEETIICISYSLDLVIGFPYCLLLTSTIWQLPTPYI